MWGQQIFLTHERALYYLLYPAKKKKKKDRMCRLKTRIPFPLEVKLEQFHYFHIP